MSSTVFNLFRAAALCMLFSGCGLVQGVTDSTASVTRAVFYKQVKTLHLDFDGRAAVNTHSADMSALSVPTLVRIYQLRDGKSVERATYDDLLENADHLLGADLIEQRSVVVKPGEGVQLSIPMDENARVVAVVGLFRDPDVRMNTWRLTLNRDDLDPDRPRVMELGDNKLTLRPVAGE